jgi:hypothetical protein
VPWALDRNGASAFNRRGDVDARIEAPTLKGMEIAALTFIDDDFLFAYQHAQSTTPDRPALARLGRNGAVRWSSRLTSEAITFDSRPRDGATEDESGRLLPATWVCGYLAAGDLTIAGDTVLAVYADMPRSGLAMGYAVALADGALRYTTAQGPIDQVASRSPGEFLVGYMGYGAFQTVLYDRGGNRLHRWDSQGHYVISGDDVRVIEMENRGVSRSRLARLNDDGSVIRGDLLEGYSTSEPYLHDDGTIYFARDGMLVAARDLLIDDRIVIRKRSEDGVFHTRVLAGHGGLFSTYSTNVHSASTSTSGSIGHISGLVRVAI